MSSANPSPAFGFAFYRTADERWVMPLNPYPKIKVAAQNLLDVPDDRAARRRRPSPDGTRATWRRPAAEAGVVLPMLRSTEELLAEPHYREALADLPLVEITRIGDSVPMPLPAGVADPLTGVRALGMGHVIAGAGTGRALALHGADVLNLWRPDELEHENTYATANVGVRSATLDPYSADGRARIATLLADADVFFANRRPGYLSTIGLSAEQARRAAAGHRAREHHAQRAHRAVGDRVGFDQTAGSLVGMMTMEGDGEDAGVAADRRGQRLHRVLAAGHGHRRGAGRRAKRGRQLPGARLADPRRAVDPQHGRLRPRLRHRDGGQRRAAPPTSTRKRSLWTLRSAATRASPNRSGCP